MGSGFILFCIFKTEEAERDHLLFIKMAGPGDSSASGGAIRHYLTCLVSGSDQLLPPASQCSSSCSSYQVSVLSGGTFITDISPHCPAWLPCQWPAHPHHDTIVIIVNRNKEHSVNILIRVPSVKVCSVSFPLRMEKSEIVMMNKLDSHWYQAQLNLK